MQTTRARIENEEKEAVLGKWRKNAQESVFVVGFVFINM